MDRTAALRAHRREEAGQGFPLPRACPSTFVLRRLAVLDGFSGVDRLDYADQLSDLAEAQVTDQLAQAGRDALVARLPLVARTEASALAGADLRFQSVKSLARLAAEPGGIAEFARMQGLVGEASGPPLPHVASFEEAVPVPPGRLRKAVIGALQLRFGGAVRKVSADLEQLEAVLPRGRMLLNLGFGGKGWGAMSRQLHYSLWADLDGVRMLPTAYEAVWLLPALWDLITVANVETVAAHLVRVVEARLALEG